MRPLRLELEGFGPYRTRQAVDFSDVELFVLTGPTGAGKTTILDAIAFALYAKTPRGFKKYGELVHPGAEVARVQLVFQAGDGVYRVTRAVGKKSEHRLEREEGGRFRTLPDTEKVKALNERLERVLGLSFDAFTRAILLPQGEFDRFLKGEPKERRALLSSLFGLETLAAMRERAGAHREEVARRLERIEGELAGLGEGEPLEVLREALESKRAELKRAEEALAAAERALAELQSRFERFQELDEARRALAALRAREEEMAELEKRLSRAEAAARLIPELNRLEEEEKRIEKIRAERDARKGRLEALRERLREVASRADPHRLAELLEEEARLKGLMEKRRWLSRLGRPEDEGEVLPFDALWVQELLEMRRSHAELARERRRAERLRSELKDVKRAAEELEQAMAELADQGTRLGEELKAAEAELKEAELRAGLAAYHAYLRPGEPCPLCGQVVPEPPPKPEGPDALGPLRERVEELKARVEALRNEYRALRSERQAKEMHAEKLARELSELEKALGEREAGLPPASEVEARLAAMARGLLRELGEEDPEARLTRVRAEQAALKEAVSKKEALEKEQGELERALAGLSERLLEAERARKAMQSLFEARLAEVGFRDVAELKASALPEAEWARIMGELEQYQKAREALSAKVRALEDALKGEAPPSPAALKEARERTEGLKSQVLRLSGEVGELTERLRRLEAEEKRRKVLEKERAELSRELRVWEKLVTDLRSDRFPEYLIHHYQRGLVDRASEILAELYQNRYRLLAEGGDYFVEDTWTRSVRPVRTLSGGESFLASLALALALSERLSGGKLGALFLDEGFGTLDQETLEFAAGVLETLPTRGRLVGIVTHVAELAERFPERLVVEKSPTGSRVYWTT